MREVLQEEVVRCIGNTCTGSTEMRVFPRRSTKRIVEVLERICLVSLVVFTVVLLHVVKKGTSIRRGAIFEMGQSDPQLNGGLFPGFEIVWK